MGMRKKDNFLEVHKQKIAIRVRAAVNVILSDLRIDLINAMGPDMMKGADLQTQQGVIAPLPVVSAIMEKYAQRVSDATAKAVADIKKEEKKKLTA